MKFPFLLVPACLAFVPMAEAETLTVDRRGGARYATISEAVAAAKPGDVIQVAPDSGPYREAVVFRNSGEPENPITLDGGNVLVTGFEPLTGFREEGGKWICELPLIPTRTEKNPAAGYPCLLAYQGERLVVDPHTRQFTKYARLSEDNKRIELLPGTKTEGWEIATRDIAIAVRKASNLVIRNIRASGSTNDGFNVHSTCENLLFENVEAFQNFDEGFSIHDVCTVELRNARIWGNDNGLWNHSSPSIKFTCTDVEIFSNLGFGLWLRKSENTLKNVKVWDNGLGQVYLGGKITCSEVTAYESRWGERPWETYQETKGIPPRKATVTIDPETEFVGDHPIVKAAADLPPLKEP